MIDFEIVERDRCTRWNPIPRSVQHAMLLLEQVPEADMVVIPMYQPGKQYGIWEYGQEVRTVYGVYLLAVNKFESDSLIPTHHWAREAAHDIARNCLGTREGTVAHAVVRRDSAETPVFEDL